MKPSNGTNEKIRDDYAEAVAELREFEILHRGDRYADRAHRQVDEAATAAQEALDHELGRWAEVPLDPRTNAGQEVSAKLAALYVAASAGFTDARHAAVDRLTWSDSTEAEVVAERAKLQAAVSGLEAELESRRQAAELELAGLR